MFIAASLEMVSVGMVYPFVYILTNPDTILEDSRLRYLYTALDMTSPVEFFVWGGVGIIIFYLLKNSYLTVFIYFQEHFISYKEAELSRRLFKIYLYQPYTFHLQANTAEILLKTTSEVGRLSRNVLLAGMQLVTEAFIVIFIAIFLFVASPLTSIGAIVFIGGSSFVFYQIFRKRVMLLGKMRQYYYQKMIQLTNEGLGVIKELKILGKERFFIELYTEHSLGQAHVRSFMGVVNRLPRLFLDTIVVSSFIGMILFILFFEQQKIDLVLPTLSLFAVAAFRIMPSMNKVISFSTTIRHFLPSFYVVYDDLVDAASILEASDERAVTTSPPAISFQREIELYQVYYQYPDAEDEALIDISLVIPKGTSVGFVGSSGGGKTTLVNLILGLLSPVKGQILVDGQNIESNLPGWQRKLGYIPQDIYLADNTIRRNIALGLSDEQIDENRVWEVISLANLDELINQLPNKLDTIVGERGVRLSGGQRQRIAIARAFYHRPELIIMDEATAALDNVTEHEVIQAIERLSIDKTLIIIAHRLSTVKNCDVLYFMNKGQIIASGTYDKLLESNEAFKTMANQSAN